MRDANTIVQLELEQFFRYMPFGYSVLPTLKEKIRIVGDTTVFDPKGKLGPE